MEFESIKALYLLPVVAASCCFFETDHFSYLICGILLGAFAKVLMIQKERKVILFKPEVVYETNQYTLKPNPRQNLANYKSIEKLGSIFIDEYKEQFEKRIVLVKSLLKAMKDVLDVISFSDFMCFHFVHSHTDEQSKRTKSFLINLAKRLPAFKKELSSNLKKRFAQFIARLESRDAELKKIQKLISTLASGEKTNYENLRGKEYIGFEANRITHNLSYQLASESTSTFMNSIEEIQNFLNELKNETTQIRRDRTPEPQALSAKKASIKFRANHIINTVKVFFDRNVPDEIKDISVFLKNLFTKLEVIIQKMQGTSSTCGEFLITNSFYMKVLTILQKLSESIKQLDLTIDDHFEKKKLPSTPEIMDEVVKKYFGLFDMIKSIFEFPVPNFLTGFFVKYYCRSDFVIPLPKQVQGSSGEENLHIDSINRIMKIFFLEWSRSPSFEVY